MSRNSEHLDIDALSALIDHQDTAAARAVAERHLASCAQCAARKAALESAAKALAGLAKIAPTADETRAMRRAVLDAKPRRLAWWPARPLASTRQALAAGTAVAALLAGVIWFGVVGIGSAPSSSAPAALGSGHVITVPSPPRAAPAAAVPLTGSSAGNPAPESSIAIPPIVVFNGSKSTGGTLFVPASPTSFSTETQVASYVAGQTTVRDEADALTAGSASITNSQFLAAIGGAAPASSTAGALPASPSPAVGSTTSTAAGSAGSGSTSGSTNGTANGTASGVAPAPPAGPASPLAECVEQVVDSVPQPAAAIEATPISYQGTPAWLIVLATAPGSGASPSPSQALGRERFWVQSQASCATLTQGTV